MPTHLTVVDPVDNRIFVQTASQTVTNTAAETTALGSGIGSKTIAAGQLKVGSRVRVSGRGIYSTPAVIGSLSIKVMIGSVVVATVTTSSISLGVTNKAWTFICDLVVTAIGATGSVTCGGEAAYSTGVGGNKVYDDLDNAGTPVTVDTTVDMPVDVRVQWDAASTSRKLTTTIASIMVV